MIKSTSRAFALIVIASASMLRAQVPQLINYQGRVAVGTTNFDGTGQFKFALVDGTGSVTYWSNDGTTTASNQPAAAVSLTVTKGLYSVLLGNTALPNMTALPATVFANTNVQLRVWFNDGVHGSQLLTPDQRIAAAGFAIMAQTALAAPPAPWNVLSSANEGTVLASNAKYVVINLNQSLDLQLPASPQIGDSVRVKNASHNGAVYLYTPGVAYNIVLTNLPRSWLFDANSLPVTFTAMAASADLTTLVGVVAGGGVYTSTDTGLTWTLRSNAGSRPWKAVASSADGTRLVATASSTNIFVSTNSGATWASHGSSGNWISVASSSDGTKLAALVPGPAVFTSTDSGNTWTGRNADSAGNSTLKCVASSANGSKLITLAGTTSGSVEVYTSSNSGTNWSPAYDFSPGYWTVACDANCSTVLATSSQSQTSTGSPYVSHNGGGSWTPCSPPFTAWNSVASSSDGATLATLTASGSLYTSYDSGVNWTNEITAVANSFVAISQNDPSEMVIVGQGTTWHKIGSPSQTYVWVGRGGGMLELVYMGNGIWLMVDSAGDISTL